MVKLENIRLKYSNNTVLDNFSLNVKKEQRVCLFGQSGCGKTSVLKIIAGILTPNGGSISVNGTVSMVFQDDRLVPNLTVLQNLTLINGNEQKAKEILKRLNIYGKANELPEKLSGGQSRRVAIARALCKPSDILILDEPFNGIDEENVKTVCEQILKFYRDKTIIMVSHDKAHAELMGAEIIELQ